MKWVVIPTSDLIPKIADAIENAHPEMYLDVEDIVEAAVYHLNERDRPLVLDHLFNMFDGRDIPEEFADAMEYSASRIYRHLSPLIPTNLHVTGFDYVGLDIMIGGVPLE
jgi:hypothetical protein